MKIAITGGTGFVGRHLARTLAQKDHEIILIARGLDDRDKDIRNLSRARFFSAGLDDEDKLTQIFKDCNAVAHCAGINREIDQQTYQRVHIAGTGNVVNAAKRAGVKKILLMSFLRARPNCHSPYHESKWTAEEIIRSSGINYTVIKAGMIYGKGDHMLDHLSHAICTLPLFASVGLFEKSIRPIAIEDVVKIMGASITENRLSNQSVAVTGPEEMPFSDAVKRVAKVLKKRILIFPLPVWFHYFIARLSESSMKVPLISRAQVKMLSEGIAEAFPVCDELPEDLKPKIFFTEQQILKGLPQRGPFKRKDFLGCGNSRDTKLN